jgi:excinuclease UvrABC ATPase subunit
MTIEICDKCKGSGFLTIEDPNDYGEYITISCPECGGTGRVRVVKYCIKIVLPFTSDVHEINRIDSEVHNFVREKKLKWQ